MYLSCLHTSYTTRQAAHIARSGYWTHWRNANKAISTAIFDVFKLLFDRMCARYIPLCSVWNVFGRPLWTFQCTMSTQFLLHWKTSMHEIAIIIHATRPIMKRTAVESGGMAGRWTGHWEGGGANARRRRVWLWRSMDGAEWLLGTTAQPKNVRTQLRSVTIQMIKQR